MKMLSAVALAATFFVTTAASAAALVGPSTSNPLANTVGGVRFRAFDLSPPPSGSAEVFVGRDLGSVPANYAQGNLTWGATNNFTINYDSATDRLSATVRGVTTTFNSDFRGGVSGPLSRNGLNRLSISLRDADSVAPNSTVGLTNLVLNGMAVSPNAIGATDDNVLRYFSIGGDFRQSFTLSGTLNLAGDFSPGGQEGSRVEFLVGNNGVPEPAAWAMMIGGFGFAGVAMRRRSATRSVLA